MGFNSWEQTGGLALFSNPNILHNWDFRNSSTIVNQRGQTMYSTDNSIYSIDRWLVSRGSLEIRQGYVRLTRLVDTIETNFIQHLEFSQIHYGATVTLSIQTTEGLFSATGIVPLSNGVNGITLQLGSSPFVFVLRRQWNGGISIFVADFSGVGATGDYLDIQAVKLEYGTVSTLANDPPMNFGRELAICQRYQVVLNIQRFRLRASWVQANNIGFYLPLTTPLRIRPSITNSSNLRVMSLSLGGMPAFTFATMNDSSNELGVILMATLSGHGMSDAVLDVMTGNVILDANL